MIDDPNRNSDAFNSFMIWASGEPGAKFKKQIGHLYREKVVNDILLKAGSCSKLECKDYWKQVKLAKNFINYLAVQDSEPETVRLIAKLSGFVEDSEKALIKSRMPNFIKKAYEQGQAFYKNADGTTELRKIKAESYLQKGETTMAAKEAYASGIISKEDLDNAVEWEKAMDEASAEMRARLALAPKGNENKLVSVAHPPADLSGAKCEETDDPRFVSCSSDVGKAKHPSRPTHHTAKPSHHGGAHAGRHGGAMGYHHEEGNLDCRCDECMGKSGSEEEQDEQISIRDYI